MQNQNYSIENFIGQFHNVFDQNYNAYVIQLFENAAQAGMTVDRQSSDNALSTDKDDNQMFFEQSMTYADKFGSIHEPFKQTVLEGILPLYKAKFGAMDKMDDINMFANKIQRTRPTEGYHVWHCETTSRSTSQRILSYIYYLNDIEEGGETEFLYQSLRVKPKAGTLLLFPAYFTHTHRGNPPIKDTKYIMTGNLEF